MGGSGAMSFMQTTLSNNKLLLNRREAFKKTLVGYEPDVSVKLSNKEVSPQTVKEIGNRVRREERERSQQILIFFLLAAVSIVSVIMYIITN